MKQPDFTHLFFETFKAKPQRLAYSLRPHPLCRHDVQFMSSLIHDTKFKISETTKAKRTITFKLKRYCWELGRQEDSGQLLVADSILTFTNVQSVRWVIGDISLSGAYEGCIGFENEECVDAKTEYELSNFFIGESTYLSRGGLLELVMAGYPRLWQLRIILGSERWGVKLVDVTDPRTDV